jgi:hypothetical protein
MTRTHATTARVHRRKLHLRQRMRALVAALLKRRKQDVSAQEASLEMLHEGAPLRAGE